MPTPLPQMYEQELQALKGWHTPGALDKSRPLSAELLSAATPTPAGRVVHINNDGEFALGGSGTQMPIFLWQGSNDPDVQLSGTSPVTGVTHYFGISSRGVMTGLVATGGYELQTTEFDKTRNYFPNQLLTANANGILTNAGVTPYVTWVCGVTSWHCQEGYQDSPSTGPVGTNAHRNTVLSFWSYFLPAGSPT